MTLYHNPRCAKSRETLALLKSKGIEVEIALYMTEKLKPTTLKGILKKLNMKPLDLLRKNEALYKENFKGATKTDAQWINAMIEHPQLMERPILVNKEKAAIGRPPEKVLLIL